MAMDNAPARIGKTVVIRGELKGNEDLIIDGRVEGTITLSESRLTVGATAQLAANLTARDILVLGQVSGNLYAAGRVELRAGSVVEGDIQALRLAIEDNAVFRGRVDLTVASKPAESAPAPATPATTTTTAEGGQAQFRI